MTYSYIATFPAGCFEIISRKLKEFSIEQLKILTHDESSVTFKSALKQEQLIDIRFFTNVYMILDLQKLIPMKHLLKGESYRLLTMVNGVPTETDPDRKKLFTEPLEKVLKLRANVARISNDFVIMKRAAEEEIITLKLSRAKHKRAVLPAGALRPELATILLLVAGVRPKDTLLDPFAGYGSIPTEAVRGFGLTHVKAIEKNAALVNRDDVFNGTVQGDAKNLDFIDHESIDKIVTDPPWGAFQQQTQEELRDLYSGFIHESFRILKPQGILVILSGNAVLDQIINTSTQFTVLKTFKILVSGQKATIHKLQKST